MRTPATLLLAFSLSALSCSDASSPASTVEETDSAGIRILTTGGTGWSEAERWTLDPEPELHLGSVGDDGAETFGRIVTVLRAPGGVLLVADGSALEVRVFSEGGAFEGRLGGEGEGPGELRALTSVQLLPPDTVLAFDRDLQRLSRFLLSGGLLGTRSLGELTFQGAPPFLDGVRRLPDGSLVAREGGDFVRSEAPLARDTSYFLLEADGALRAMDAVPGLRTVQAELQGRRAFGIQAFNQVPLWDVHGTVVAVAEGEPFSVRILGEEGVERILRRDRDPPPLTRTDHEAFVDLATEGVPPEERGQARELYGLLAPATHRPAYRSLLLDGAGHVWLERYGALPDEPGPEWDIYHLERGFLGSVATPVGLRIHDVGSERVVGVWTDELGAEHVRVHRLRR